MVHKSLHASGLHSMFKGLHDAFRNILGKGQKRLLLTLADLERLGYTCSTFPILQNYISCHIPTITNYLDSKLKVLGLTTCGVLQLGVCIAESSSLQYTYLPEQVENVRRSSRRMVDCMRTLHIESYQKANRSIKGRPGRSRTKLANAWPSLCENRPDSAHP